MKKLVLGLAFLLSLSLTARQSDSPIVKTKAGIVRGVTEEDVSSFKGPNKGFLYYISIVN